jgi:hypothetical protein
MDVVWRDYGVSKAAGLLVDSFQRSHAVSRVRLEIVSTRLPQLFQCTRLVNPIWRGEQDLRRVESARE